MSFDNIYNNDKNDKIEKNKNTYNIDNIDNNDNLYINLACLSVCLFVCKSVCIRLKSKRLNRSGPNFLRDI